MRRRTPPAGSLVSLLDVLFILVFASLVQSQARGEVTAEKVEEVVADAPPTTPGPPVPAPPAPLAAVRTAAAAAAANVVAGAPLIVARIDVDGVLTEVEREGDKRALTVPLIEHTPDRDVEYAYLGDRAPALQVCGVIARELRVQDLAGHVVAIVPSAAAEDRLRILAQGLARDVGRCMAEQHAMALIVDVAAESAPQAPTPGGTP